VENFYFIVRKKQRERLRELLFKGCV